MNISTRLDRAKIRERVSKMTFFQKLEAFFKELQRDTAILQQIAQCNPEINVVYSEHQLKIILEYAWDGYPTEDYIDLFDMLRKEEWELNLPIFPTLSYHEKFAAVRIQCENTTKEFDFMAKEMFGTPQRFWYPTYNLYIKTACDHEEIRFDPFKHDTYSEFLHFTRNSLCSTCIYNHKQAELLCKDKFTDRNQFFSWLIACTVKHLSQRNMVISDNALSEAMKNGCVTITSFLSGQRPIDSIRHKIPVFVLEDSKFFQLELTPALKRLALPLEPNVLELLKDSEVLFLALLETQERFNLIFRR